MRVKGCWVRHGLSVFRKWLRFGWALVSRGRFSNCVGIEGKGVMDDRMLLIIIGVGILDGYFLVVFFKVERVFELRL